MEAGAQVGADVVAGADGWGVVIQYGRARHTLVAARGQARTFRQFESLLAYLRDLDILEVRVSTAGFESTAAVPRSIDT